MNMRNLTVGLVVAVALMGGFYAGFRYERSKAAPAAPVATTGPAGAAAATPAARAGTGPSPGAGVGGFGGRGTAGQVVSLDGSTLTIRDSQGTEVRVTLQGSTAVSRTVPGSAGDLTQGAAVTVAGQRGSDGSVAATAITILPAGAAVRPGG